MIEKAFVSLVLAVLGLVAGATLSGAQAESVQAQAVLTVSESKRLIAKAVANMPEIRSALKNGMVIITKGTTNTYVAEEILGRKLAHGALLSGRTVPAESAPVFENVAAMSEIVLVNGVPADSLSLAEAVRNLKQGDVVIKGANLLDYEHKTAGVLIGSNTAGTTGTFFPTVVARKVHLVIPVGLEKQASGNVLEIAGRMREPVPSINETLSMFLLTGTIVTEIEALKILADVSAFQIAAGGINGAEGAVTLVFRGTRANVEKALKLVESVQGEPPFVE